MPPLESRAWRPGTCGAAALCLSIAPLAPLGDGMATRKSHKIDRIDLKILSALQDQGRMSNLELAAKAGLSASPAHARHRSLERSKVIQGYRADIDLAKLTDYVEILSFFTLHKHGRTQQGAFERLIERTPQAIANAKYRPMKPAAGHSRGNRRSMARTARVRAIWPRSGSVGKPVW